MTDFFSNLTEFRNATNGLMQARPDAAGRAVIRFALNSTVGVLGPVRRGDAAGRVPRSRRISA